MGLTTDDKDPTMVLSANELKLQGNQYFSARKYGDAVSCYTKAIIRNPHVATYYTNRALCYLKLKQWELACQDCRRAIETDANLVKGHFFQGQALLELQLFDEAIASLMRAHELAKDQKQNFGDDITSVLRLARKRKFSLAEEKRIQQEIELQTHINELIRNNEQRHVTELDKVATDDIDMETEIQELQENTKRQIQQVNELFAQVDDRRKKRDVPDILCSKISFEIMRDPVITPSGITYDRRDIEEHLQRVGHFDPITRKDLTMDQLIPNLAMKEVIDSFLEENPWAEDY